MTSLAYKGFKILARPYQLFESGRWAVDFDIRRNGMRQRFSLGERYSTEREADARCSGLGRKIIDGRIEGWSVDYLRGVPNRRSAFINVWKEQSMRGYLIAGIVVFVLGAFVLLRGANFITRRNVLEVGDVKITADEKQTVPPWTGGVAMVVGAALMVAGGKKRA